MTIGLSHLSNRLLPSQSTLTDRLGDLDKARLAEALHLRQSLGDSLWPGWGQADIPMILYNEEFAFLAGYPNPPAGWVKIPENSNRGGPWETVPGDPFEGREYYRQRLSDAAVSPQAFVVLVGGRWVSSMMTRDWSEIRLGNEFKDNVPPAVQPLVPYRLAARLFLSAAGGKDWYICALLHESFHAFEGITVPERLAAAETTYNGNQGRYPWNSDSFAKGWQMELDLLADAVQARSDARAVELASQFLVQREKRRTDAGLDAILIDLERQKEWEEGLAKYTELSIWRLAATTDGYSALPAMAGDPGFKNYSDFERQWSQQIDQIRRMAGDEGDTRFYYSGLAQAILLDRLAGDWRTQAMTDGALLEELLRDAVEKN
jgi:hypothetical protein